MPQTVTIKAGDEITIIVETLESYPIKVTWEDALNVAANKISQTAREVMNAKAHLQQQGTGAAPSIPTPSGNA
jgi:hypothetical protein